MRSLYFALVLAMSSVVANGAPAMQNCKLVRIAELPIRIEDNRLVADGAINGQKVGILLDTGAGTSFIHRSSVTRLGLIPQEVVGYRTFAIGGETSAHAVHVDKFEIGQFLRRNWRVLVAGEGAPRGDVAVYLGYDFFQSVDIEFDLAHHAARLFQPMDCEGVSLAYWTTEPAGEAAIEPGPRLEVTIQINGQPARALLDSGATSSIVAMDFAGRLGLTPESSGVVAAGCSIGLGKKPVETWIAQFQTFAIGNELVRNPSIRFADVWKDVTYTETGSRVPRHVAGLPSMLLGADFLRAHRLMVAHSQRKIYFTHTGGTVFPATPAKGCGER
ncbi:MAG: aspartyl protease family protein [Betaproteobacteria bacterium]|nr:aspartyl protease family protein [Betaproteobacteria bacterium]